MEYLTNDGATEIDRPAPRWAALAYETTSARNLLRSGRNDLINIRMNDWDLDPVLTQLSIGVEKLIKLTLGMITTQDTGQWTNTKNHKLRDLNSIMMQDLRARTTQARLPITADLDRVGRSPVWTALLDTLHDYGAGGRFHNLDRLGGTFQAFESPLAHWQAVEDAVIEKEPDLLSGLASVERYQDARSRLNHRIADALTDWHQVVYDCWRRGLIGDLAKRFATDLDLRSLG